MQRTNRFLALAGGLAALAALAARAAQPEAPPGTTMQRIHQRIQELQDVCRKDAASWDARVELAQIYLRFGYGERAAPLLDEAVALRPDHAATLALSAEALCQLKEYDKAIERWKKAQALDPNDKGIPARIAWAQKRRQEDTRLAELDAILAKTPGDRDALVARATARVLREEWPAALADGEALLKAKANDPDGLGIAGLAHYRLGHVDDAIRLWTTLASLDAAHAGPYLAWLEQAKAQKSTYDELASVEAKLRDSPADGALRLRAGELSSKLRRWHDALRHLAEAVRLIPRDAAAHRAYAIALSRVGMMDEAVKELETCVKLEPGNAEHAKLLASMKNLRDMHRSMKKGAEE